MPTNTRLLNSILYKKPTNSGYIYLKKSDQMWSAELDDSEITYRWGKIGGSIQEQVSEVEFGKNIGRANETTPHEQAIIEVRSKINKKIMEGYEAQNLDGVFFGMKFKKITTCPTVMLAKVYVDHKKKLPKKVIVQPKLDGIRCVANTITGELFSRRREPITSVPHISRKILEMNLHDELGAEWVDGELYRHGMDFQKIQSIVRTQKSIHKDSEEIQYHIYDYISDEPNIQRMAKMSCVGLEDPLVFVKSKITDDVMSAQAEFVAEGYEGTMVRDPSAPYQQKRSDKLLKLKDFIQEEFEIIGMDKEEFEETLGAFVLRTKSGLIFRSRPAFGDEERAELWISGVPNDSVATVKFQEYTPDGMPRFPVTVGIRSPDDR